MANLNGRITQLEKANGVNVRNKYMCIVYEPGVIGDPRTPEEKTRGYKIQPFIPSFGGTGESVFYLATRAELDAFAARPDVDLTVIVVGYAKNNLTELENV